MSEVSNTPKILKTPRDISDRGAVPSGQSQRVGQSKDAGEVKLSRRTPLTPKNPDGEIASRHERGTPGDASGSARVSDSPGVRSLCLVTQAPHEFAPTHEVCIRCGRSLKELVERGF